jgi:hypothetical protein
MQPFQSFTTGEEDAISYIRAAIDAAETLLGTDAPSMEQRSELEEGIRTARAALAHYIRERMRGKTEAGTLGPVDEFEPELAVGEEDVTVRAIAEKAIVLSLYIAGLGTSILVSRLTACDEPPTPWEMLGSALGALGMTIEGIGNTTFRRAMEET